MRNYLKILSIFLFISVIAFMITGCEKENSPAQVDTTSTGQDLQQQIEDRITELVEEATDDKVLQEEMREELRFLIDNDVVRWNDVTIYYDSKIDDFFYIYNGDNHASKSYVQKWMKHEQENQPLSIRSHRRANYLVNPATYTVYIHTDVDPYWATAVSQAISEWNGLGLTVSFSYGGYTSSYYTAGAITVFMANLTGAYADAGDPTYYGDPSYYLRIDDYDWGLGTSQKKFIMAHELGHTIGFKHTNTLEGNPLTSVYYPCILSMCDGSDLSSVMRQGGGTPPSWVGFSTCDVNVFQCIYGYTVI